VKFIWFVNFFFCFRNLLDRIKLPFKDCQMHHYGVHIPVVLDKCPDNSDAGPKKICVTFPTEKECEVNLSLNFQPWPATYDTCLNFILFDPFKVSRPKKVHILLGKIRTKNWNLSVLSPSRQFRPL
jgi:hypothetical protein